MNKPGDKVKIEGIYGVWEIAIVERGKTPELYYCVNELLGVGKWFQKSKIIKQKNVISR